MINEKNFEDIFREHFKPLTNLSYSIVKDVDSAKDVVQQVFIKVWNNLDKLKIQSSAYAYLHRAVVNTSLNHLEKQKKLNFQDDMQGFDKADSNVSPEDIHQSEEVKNAVKQAISQLPPKCQTVFSLSRYQGHSNKEIAEELNISIKAVEKHITKALKDLRISLKPFIQQMNKNSIIIFLFLVEAGRVMVSFICHLFGGQFNG